MPPRYLLIPALALLCVPATALASDTWDHSFPAGKHPRVVISAADAHVIVHARPGATVDAHVTSKGKTVGIYFGSRKPEVTFDQSGETIRITARSGSARRESGSGFMITWLSLTADVEVPPGCDLEIENTDGAVEVDGVEGRVAVRSADGRVDLSDLRGDVQVRTSDGPVTVAGLDGRFAGSTSDGSMRVSGRFDALDLDSHDGHVVVNVERGSRIEDSWNISTQDGGLDIGIPDELQATLDARVEDGGIRVNLPKAELGYSNASAIRIDLNGGGPVLRVRSSDGTVKIRSASSGS